MNACDLDPDIVSIDQFDIDEIEVYSGMSRVINNIIFWYSYQSTKYAIENGEYGEYSEEQYESLLSLKLDHYDTLIRSGIETAVQGKYKYTKDLASDFQCMKNYVKCRLLSDLEKLRLE